METTDLSRSVQAPVGEGFWGSLSLTDLAREQGVQPIAEPAALVATFWEEDEEEDFLVALRRWRQES